MIKVLVKVHGKSPHLTAVHIYNKETNSAVCNASWPKPGYDWKLQERDVEEFAQLSERCENCARRLRSKSSNKPSLLKSSAYGLQHAADLEKLHRWQEG